MERVVVNTPLHVYVLCRVKDESLLINVNLNEYFGLETLKLIVKQPLALTETAGKYDVLVIAHGGGISGQAGAIRHGISRALLKADPEFRPA